MQYHHICHYLSIYQRLMCNHHSKYQYTAYIKNEYPTDSRFVWRQWELPLQRNAVSPWLSANLESALWHDYMHLNNKVGCHNKAIQNYYYYHYITNSTVVIKAEHRPKQASYISPSPVSYRVSFVRSFEKFCSQLHCICRSIIWSILDSPGQAYKVGSIMLSNKVTAPRWISMMCSIDLLYFDVFNDGFNTLLYFCV